MKKIILISAKAEHGKTETAKILKERLESQGERVCIIPFAKYLKQILVDYYGWDGKTKNEYWRTMLQQIGTDETQYNKGLWNIWAKRTVEDIQIINEQYDYIIVDDWRFKKEAHYVSSVFPDETTTVRVYRLGYESSLTDEQKSHVSEVDLDGFNFNVNIYVQTGLDHLKDETLRLFDKITN